MPNKKFSFFQICAVLILVSIGAAKLNKAVPSTAQTAPSPVVNVPQTKITSGEGVSLKCDHTCNTSQINELPVLQALLNTTLNSQCLTTYFKTPNRRLDNTLGYTPDQILSKLREPTSLTVTYYFNWLTKAYGFEDARDFTTVHLNSAKTKYLTNCQKVSLLGHEFSHTKSFFHNGNKPGPNYYSVPYQINNAFEGNDDMKACCI